MQSQAKELNAWALARLAGCAAPDTLESPGARFLLSVRDAHCEAFAWQTETEGQSPREAVEHIRDEAGDVADGCVPAYTHALWATFVDLGAYATDVEDFGPVTDMTQGARTALYVVASDLVSALCDAEEGSE